MNYYLLIGLVLFAYMNFWFVVSFLKKKNDVADVAWGLGFVLIAWTSFFLAGHFALRGVLVCTLVTIWGVRLALHIYSRNKGRPEDYRYVAWRKEWGKWFYLRSYFQIYILQGTLLGMVAFPVLLVNASPATPLGILDILGTLVWLFGFYFEAVGDKQLAAFIQNPANKGKLLQDGLWKYSRHPNYFGEVTEWWGLWLVALAVPGGWIGILGPITITFLILKVSGIPLLEKKMAENPAFEEYKRRTSVFVPLPPKK